jgi:predicted NAD/FAD-binding protein
VRVHMAVSRPGVLGFSAFFVLSFCRNHHLLQIFGLPQWLTVKGPSHTYVNEVLLHLLHLYGYIRGSVKNWNAWVVGLRPAAK